MDFILILDLKKFYSSLFTTAKASNFAIDGERKQKTLLSVFPLIEEKVLFDQNW